MVDINKLLKLSSLLFFFGGDMASTVTAWRQKNGIHPGRVASTE